MIVIDAQYYESLTKNRFIKVMRVDLMIEFPMNRDQFWVVK